MSRLRRTQTHPVTGHSHGTRGVTKSLLHWSGIIMNFNWSGTILNYVLCHILVYVFFSYLAIFSLSHYFTLCANHIPGLILILVSHPNTSTKNIQWHLFYWIMYAFSQNFLTIFKFKHFSGLFLRRKKNPRK